MAFLKAFIVSVILHPLRHPSNAPFLTVWSVAGSYLYAFGTDFLIQPVPPT